MRTPEQIEAWVLSIIGLVTRRERVEDDRVELKAEWPEDLAKAARRVAGQANASGGGPILWVVGLDEQRGVVPFPSVDPAAWQAKLQTYFDGLSPSVQILSVPTGNSAVFALLFDTARRPFVVKNPVYGTQGGGAVSWEVPWRDGTAVRSARREDLVRLLVPALELPTFEILDASAAARPVSPSAHGFKTPRIAWSASLLLYVTPRSEAMLVLPKHRLLLSLLDDLGFVVCRSQGTTVYRSPDLDAAQSLHASRSSCDRLPARLNQPMPARMGRAASGAPLCRDTHNA